MKKNEIETEFTMQKLLSRPEWDKSQIEFLLKPENRRLALKCEYFLSELDEKINFLKKEQRKNPIYWIKRLFSLK